MFDPLTPREALLAIRLRLARWTIAPASKVQDEIDELARVALERTGSATFELTDLLADRLAQSHELLRSLADAALEPGSDAELIAKIPAVLALPPDLEAMVERRIGS